MLNEQQLAARRAIEALRAGVPNRDAVRALGTATPAIEERFSDLLSAAQEQGLEPHSPAGLVVAGNFGSGKSHLLAYLQDLALARGFVASKIVISKETPLYDPIKLYRAAINAAIAPGRRGPALAQLASELQPRSERYMDFYTWVQGTRDLNQRFAATVYLYEHGQQDPELQERILQFWSGDPLTIGELRRALKAQGEGISYLFDKVDQRALALQRFRFAARLIMAAGYAGWVLLVDEVELIGRYSLQQRARSYAELARWTGNLKGEAYPGISTVFAITSDYEAAILDARHDRENV
ncbi:MAG TPA: BREX system ATP-binding domain-containing protein, partial [Chloroflexota bacterium]|nr:BREX system ATP-binding domain-containing protein [Chloroflexota bacterium]